MLSSFREEERNGSLLQRLMPTSRLFYGDLHAFTVLFLLERCIGKISGDEKDVLSFFIGEGLLSSGARMNHSVVAASALNAQLQVVNHQK